MRGFLGGRSGGTGGTGGGGKKPSRPSAKDVMIEKMGGKAAEQHKMKKMLEETIQDYTANYMKAKDRRESGVHGEKSGGGKPEELNKRTKDMIAILAQQKVQKEVKTQKKKEHMRMMEEKRKVNAEVQKKVQQQALVDQKKKADEAVSAAAAAKSYFFGNTEE